MPVYGRGRKKTALYRQRHPVPSEVLRRRSRNVREYISGENPDYNYTDTLLSGYKGVSHILGFDVKKWAVGRTRRGTVSVLDWGSGKGTATEELAKQLGKRGRVYGFGKDVYKENARSSTVDFVQGTRDDFFRHFKRQRFDLIYSTWGLLHANFATNHEGALYYLKTAGLLKPGGIFVTQLSVAPSLTKKEPYVPLKPAEMTQGKKRMASFWTEIMDIIFKEKYPYRVLTNGESVMIIHEPKKLV